MRMERHHPLRRLFVELVEHRYRNDVQIRDARVAGYIAGLLADSLTLTTSTGCGTGAESVWTTWTPCWRSRTRWGRRARSSASGAYASTWATSRSS